MGLANKMAAGVSEGILSAEQESQRQVFEKQGRSNCFEQRMDCHKASLPSSNSVFDIFQICRSLFYDM